MELDLTLYHQYIKISQSGGKRYLFGAIRKKQLVLQPEELVRQSWIHYLEKEQGISITSLAVEKGIKVGESQRRYDLVYYRKGDPLMLFEFKSYEEKLTEDTCQQIAQYNLTLKVPYIVISNGMQSHLFHVDIENHIVTELKEFPSLG